MGAFLAASRGAARCSRGRSYLVALRDGYCDNGDATSESITFSYIGILCGIYDIGAFCSRGIARCSRARSCLVAIRDGRCDNGDATFDSFHSYILGDV